MNDMITIRASSLSALFDCPARWSAIHLEKKFLPSTGKALLGKAVHASTALYDQSVLDNQGLTVSEAAAAAVDAIRKPEEDVIWLEDENKGDVEDIAVSLHIKYCHHIAPEQEYQAVEVTCDRLEITDLNIALTGTTDRIRKTEEGFGISDIKTGKSIVAADNSIKTAGHAYQMGVYELLAEHAFGVAMSSPAQIIGLNTAKTIASQRVATAEIENAADLLIGNDGGMGVLEYAAKIVHSGLFFGNPKSMFCHKNYCPNYNVCKFRR